MLAPSAYAQPTAKLETPAPSPALAHVVRTAVEQVIPRAAGAVVVGSPLVSDTPAPRAAALVSRIAALVAGTLGPEARAVANHLALDAARAEASSSPALVYVQAEIANGELRLTTDVFPIPKNIWDRSRNASPGPIAHGFASARIDAEVRTFLAPIPLVASATDKVPLPNPDVVALACSDIDGDGALELISVSRRMLTVGRIRQKTLVPLREAAWQSLSPIAPAPWRQPMASLVVSSGSIDIGLTDRAQSVRLGPELSKIAAYDGMPVPTLSGLACAQRRIGSLTAELQPCVPAERAQGQAPFPFDAIAAARIVGANGQLRGVWAVRSPTDGTVSIEDDRGSKQSVQSVGAQLALSDIDLDGDPDLVASKNVLNPANDGLVIRSWRGSGRMEKRLEIPISDGIAAIAVCPVDGPKQATIAVATSKELWILR